MIGERDLIKQLSLLVEPLYSEFSFSSEEMKRRSIIRIRNVFFSHVLSKSMRYSFIDMTIINAFFEKD